MSNSQIIGIGTANPSLRLTQEQSFHAAGYQSDRVRKMFVNSEIDYRHFYLEGGVSRDESSDQLNQRYLRGAMKTGCRAIVNCLAAAGRSVRDVDFLAVCTCTGYVCPDLGSRLIAHMGFRNDICADGAAAFLLRAGDGANVRYPQVVDFQTFLDPDQIEEVGLRHQNGKLRIVLGASIHKLAGPMIEKALQRLLERHGLSRCGIRFWVVHPGGRKVINDVQAYLGLTDQQTQFSRTVLRNYGNMSSPTVMFVLDEVVRNGDPHPGDWGVMVALGPGMAAEVALLRW